MTAGVPFLALRLPWVHVGACVGELSSVISRACVNNLASCSVLAGSSPVAVAFRRGKIDLQGDVERGKGGGRDRSKHELSNLAEESRKAPRQLG